LQYIRGINHGGPVERRRRTKPTNLLADNFTTRQTNLF
jgi:hypothetical protein